MNDNKIQTSAFSVVLVPALAAFSLSFSDISMTNVLLRKRFLDYPCRFQASMIGFEVARYLCKLCVRRLVVLQTGAPPGKPSSLIYFAPPIKSK